MENMKMGNDWSEMEKIRERREKIHKWIFRVVAPIQLALLGTVIGVTVNKSIQKEKEEEQEKEWLIRHPEGTLTEDQIQHKNERENIEKEIGVIKYNPEILSKFTPIIHKEKLDEKLLQERFITEATGANINIAEIDTINPNTVEIKKISFEGNKDFKDGSRLLSYEIFKTQIKDGEKTTAMDTIIETKYKYPSQLHEKSIDPESVKNEFSSMVKSEDLSKIQKETEQIIKEATEYYNQKKSE